LTDLERAAAETLRAVTAQLKAPPPPAPRPDLTADITKVNESLRTTAKWLLTSFAAIGALLVAGIQLSSVGSLTGETPDSRIVAVIAGITIAVVGIAAAMWWTSKVLVTFLNSFRSARARPDITNRVLGDREVIGLSYDELNTRIRRVSAELSEADTPDERTALLVEWQDLAERRRMALALIGSEILKERFEAARSAIIVGSIFAATGLAMFAWGANPPANAETPAVSLGKAPVLLNVHLTAQGIEGLKTARGCADADISALQIAGSPSAREVISVPADRCKAVRFVLTPDVGTASAAG
jgi:hypothetical protein